MIVHSLLSYSYLRMHFLRLRHSATNNKQCKQWSSPSSHFWGVGAFKSNYLCVASFLTANKKSYAATFAFVYFSPYSLRLCIFCLGRSVAALLCNSFILSARAQMRTGEGRLCDSSLITLGWLWLCIAFQHVNTYSFLLEFINEEIPSLI